MENGRSGIVAIPFTLGVAAGHKLLSFSHDPWLCCSVLFTLLVLLLSFTIFLKWRDYVPYVTLFFLTGGMCIMSSEVSSVWGYGDTNPVMGLASRAGEDMKLLIDGIPFHGNETGAMLKALICGDRSGLSATTKEIFRRSGASHILALSGLHLGLVYAILLKLLFFMGNSPSAKKAKSAAVIAITGAYTLATGAGASLTRAFIFICVNETLKLLGRGKHLEDVFFTSLLIQLTISPTSLFGTGFQLSYLAMAGIAFVYPRMESWYPKTGHKDGPVRKIWQSAALSISCQLFTGPLAWVRFGSFPACFLMSNLIGMPITWAVMALSIACLGFSALGHCPVLLAQATEKTVSTLTWALTVISEMQ